MDLEEQDVHTSKQLYPNQKYPIDGQVFKSLIIAGLTWLRTNQEIVNILNVYPIPDGDTGTNMVLTMQAACEKIANSTERNIGKLTHMVADGALSGARGNSGVILSQLWRGFASSLDNFDILDGQLLSKALRHGSIIADHGVIKPVEGTILTVAREVAEEAERSLVVTEDPYDILDRIVPAADASVLKTPELLPVLKKAGVVDAGGKGLFFILDGMSRYIKGLPLDVTTIAIQPLGLMKLENALESIEPGQDFEWVVDFHPNEKLNIPQFYEELQQIGTSIQLGEGDGIYRMHIHVPINKRFEPIQYIESLGVVTKAAMENLRAQMDKIEHDRASSVQLTPVEPGKIASVTVTPGPGIAHVFADLGVSAIVSGGQSMNPSTQEILNAFENLPTDQVIILPNNKNIILAAQSAAELSIKHVIVIPSTTVPQGIEAMMRMIATEDIDTVVSAMKDAINSVDTGEITTATRNAEIDGIRVKEGQIISMLNGKIIFASNSLKKATMGLLSQVNDGHFDAIDIFYGADESPMEVEKIVKAIIKKYPKSDVTATDGGQPNYQLIISIH